MMKIRLLLGTFALAAGMAFPAAAQDAFTLRGEIGGMEGKKIYLMYGDAAGQQVTDSVVVEKRGFVFSGKVGEVSNALLAKDLKRLAVGSSTFTRLWLEPADMVFDCPTGDLRQFTMTGSRTQGEQAAADNIQGTLQDVIDERLREMGVIWRFFDIKRLNGADNAGITISREILTDPTDLNSVTTLEIAPDDPRWALPFYNIEAELMGWEQNAGWE